MTTRWARTGWLAMALVAAMLAVAPAVIASVSSTGADEHMRSFAIEVSLPEGNSMQFLGVRIKQRPTC